MAVLQVQRPPEELPENRRREASRYVAGVKREVAVEFQPHHRRREAVDAPVSGGVHDLEGGQLREDFPVLFDERRAVVLHPEDYAGIEDAGGDEERDDDLVDLMENIPGESTAGEHHCRNSVGVVTGRRLRAAALDDPHRSNFF